MTTSTTVAASVSSIRLTGRASGCRLLGRSFGFALAGNVLYALSQWLLLVVLAKLGTPGIVGQFSFALAVTAPVFLFSQLNLRGIQATDARGDFSFADYALLRGFTTVAAMILIVGGCAWFGRDGETALIITVGTAKAFDSVTDVIQGHWQRSDRFDGVSAVTTLNGVVSLAAMTAAFMSTGSVTAAAAGFAFGSAVALAAALLIDRYGMRGTVRWRGGRLTNAIAIGKIALPLGPVMLLVAVNANVPRYFLAFHEGNRAVGVFAAVSYLAVVGTTLVGALGQSVSPRLAAAYATGNSHEFARMVTSFLLFVCAIGLAGVAVAAVAGSALLSAFYSPEYRLGRTGTRAHDDRRRRVVRGVGAWLRAHVDSPPVGSGPSIHVRRRRYRQRICRAHSCIRAARGGLGVRGRRGRAGGRQRGAAGARAPYFSQ